MCCPRSGSGIRGQGLSELTNPVCASTVKTLSGWTGLVARLIELFAEAQADEVLESEVAGFQVQDDRPERVASVGRTVYRY